MQGGKMTLEDVFTDSVNALLKKKAYEHASLAVKTTKDKLQGLIGKALEEGQGIEELGRAIRKEFGGMSRERGVRIARTEVTDTVNEGTVETLRKEGHRQKEWSTVIDGRERETHHKANNQVVNMDDSFRIGDYTARYPGDENLPAEERINCRCAVLAAGFDADRKRHFGRTFLRAHISLEKKFVVALHRAFAAQRDRVLSRL